MSTRTALGSELTVRNAAALHAELTAALRGASPIELDLSGVSEFDSAGLQLLVAAKKSAAALGKELQLIDPAEPVVEVLRFLSLTDEFPAERAP
jgi:anti-anti-sigma factor